MDTDAAKAGLEGWPESKISSSLELEASYYCSIPAERTTTA